MATDEVLVAIKSRPLIRREKSEKSKPQWSVQDRVIFQIAEDGSRVGEPYSFDHIFNELTTNEQMYKAVVEPLVDSFLQGFNLTIFAYGQTSSGKTFTMMGSDNTQGIIQMAINNVFEHVKHNPQRRYLICCSYFEIYNEKINDLLDNHGQDLKIREDFYGSIFVNAKEEIVTQQSQVYELMKIGNRTRKIGSTNMNERSSRSHTIFRFTIKSTDNNIENGPVQLSQLNLVDLAGSERIAHTKAAGVRLKEGVNINKSLLALGNVIRQLSEGEGFINYRDSNLTRLLQHALGGNAKSLIIATITVAAGEETKSTLEFAQRAKVIKNKPIVNQILSEQEKLKQYELLTANYKERLENERLRILEMENEKEQREQEILKLKKQVKLVDIFTKGRRDKHSESKVTRRHTVGHYTSRVPLETIPESKILCTNIMQDSQSECIKQQLEDEELFFTLSSEESNDEHMKLDREKSTDERSLLVTPEPSEDLLQESVTPTSQLRERLRHLEESYDSLQEFTRLESEFKEDKTVIQELVKEKENLLKDVIDLNTVIKDINHESGEMRLQLENEIATLRTKLDNLREKCNELAYALELAETDKDELRLSKEQLLNEKEFHLEQVKLKFEKQIQYFMNEIQRLNEECETEKKIDYDFETELRKLKSERITDYEERITELEAKLRKLEENDNEDNYDMLSVSTRTEELEDININTERKEMLQYKANIEEECSSIKAHMDNLKNGFERSQCLIASLNAELHEYRKKQLSLGVTEENIGDVNGKVAQNEEKEALLVKIRNLENENQTLQDISNIHMNETLSKDDEIIELIGKVEELEKGIDNNEDIIENLLSCIENLKSNSQSQIEVQATNEQISELTRKIIDLNKKIEQLELSCKNSDDKILFFKEQVQLKQENICKLTNRIESLEEAHISSLEEIDIFEKKVLAKTTEIGVLNDKITQMEIDFQRYEQTITANKNELQCKAAKIAEQEAAIIDLERLLSDCKENIKCFNQERESNKQKICEWEEQTVEKDSKIATLEEDNKVFKQDIIVKDNLITDLRSKLNALQMDRTSNVAEIVSCRSNLELKVDKITMLECKLEEESENYKQKINMLKNDCNSKQVVINALTERAANLEKELEKYNNQDKEELLQNIAHLQEQLEKEKETSGIVNEELKTRDEAILELNNALRRLEKIKDECEEKNIIISSLKDKFRSLEVEYHQMKESVEPLQCENNALNRSVSDLSQKNQDLEFENYNYKTRACTYRREISDKETYISQLKKRIQDLQERIQNSRTRDNQILELTDKIKHLDRDVSNSREEILTKDKEILTLTNKVYNLEGTVHDLENQNAVNISKIQNKDQYIQDMAMNIEHLTDTILSLENDAKYKDNKIQELRSTITSLDQQLNTYEQKICEFRDEISRYETKIKELTNTEPNIKELEKQISTLNIEKENLEKIIAELIHEKEEQKTKILGMENLVTDLKSLLATEIRSSTHTSLVLADMTPREVRKKKRQSIHDQRRGIDLTTGGEGEAAGQSTVTDHDLKQFIVTLISQKEELIQENKHLEKEVQGFIRELEDCRKYNSENDREIEELKNYITKLEQKGQKHIEDCADCKEKLLHIQKLEKLHRSKNFKIVELQAKIYDLENNYELEARNAEEMQRSLQSDIAYLEERMRLRPPAELKEAETQCDLMDYQQLLEKYTLMKKLAIMRRDEANILRARLGMNPDEPVS